MLVMNNRRTVFEALDNNDPGSAFAAWSDGFQPGLFMESIGSFFIDIDIECKYGIDNLEFKTDYLLTLLDTNWLDADIVKRHVLGWDGLFSEIEILLKEWIRSDDKSPDFKAICIRWLKDHKYCSKIVNITQNMTEYFPNKKKRNKAYWELKDMMTLPNTFEEFRNACKQWCIFNDFDINDGNDDDMMM